MSQVDGETKEIGGRKFTVYRFAPKLARRHLLKIGKVLGPSLGQVAEASMGQAKASGKDALDADIPIGEVIGGVVERLDEDYVEALMDDCAKVTHCEPGGELWKTYDAVFLGNPRAQFEWFMFALKVQFGDFLDGWAGGMSAALAGQKGPAQRSQNT